MDIDPANARRFPPDGMFRLVRIDRDCSRFTVIESVTRLMAQRIRNVLVSLHPDRDYCIKPDSIDDDPFRFGDRS